MALFATPLPDRLADVPLFEGLRRRDRREVSRHFDIISVENGTTLINEDALNHFTYFLLSGTADVRICGGVVAEVGAGDVVGERTMLGEVSTNAAVVATSDIEALVVDHRALRGLSDRFPAVRATLETIMIERAA